MIEKISDLEWIFVISAQNSVIEWHEGILCGRGLNKLLQFLFITFINFCKLSRRNFFVHISTFHIFGFFFNSAIFISFWFCRFVIYICLLAIFEATAAMNSFFNFNSIFCGWKTTYFLASSSSWPIRTIFSSLSLVRIFLLHNHHFLSFHILPLNHRTVWGIS